jgi:hypothetical protein
MSALAKAYAGSQQNKKDDPDSCNSLYHGSILQSGKRLLGLVGDAAEGTPQP